MAEGVRPLLTIERLFIIAEKSCHKFFFEFLFIQLCTRCVCQETGIGVVEAAPSVGVAAVLMGMAEAALVVEVGAKVAVVHSSHTLWCLDRHSIFTIFILLFSCCCIANSVDWFLFLCVWNSALYKYL